MSLFLVALGGFIGSISRYYVSIMTKKSKKGTWIANITGSILLAITINLYNENLLSDLLLAFLGIGFCGAYTTFSTFSYETLQLMLQKKYGAAIKYVISSFAISLLFVFIIL